MSTEIALAYHNDIKAIRRSLTDLEFALVTRGPGEIDADSATLFLGHIEQTCSRIADRVQGVE